MKWMLGDDYKHLNGEIEEMQEEIREGWLRLSSPSSSTKRREGKSSRNDPLGDSIARLVDMEALLAEKIDKLMALRLTIEEIIDTLPSEGRRLMRMRYIRRFSWLQIANRLHCDESTCRRIHRMIVRNLGDLGRRVEI